MKIGIMSMQRVVNYGSFLQAYGLKKTIESLGHTVEFVDYLSEESLVKKEQEKTQSVALKKIKNIFNMLSFSYRKYRQKQMFLNKTFTEFYNTYNEKYLPILGITSEKNYLPELDTLVIGSDEVFNCTQEGNLVGYSLQLFGKDNKAKKLISYAASFGSTTKEKLEKYGVFKEVGKYLSEFDSISVRDRNSYQLVKELCGADAPHHIDPVLLYNFDEADEIKINKKDYIVVYAYADRLNEAEIRAVRKFAKEQNKKIIALGFYQPFCDEYVLASPLEVLAYIKNSDYVITDTFHGTVFSIKYGKKFGTIIRESNKQKLGDLLSLFELSDRQIINLDNIDTVVTNEIDVSRVKQILSLKQEEALNYLKDAIS